jgi:hypothetical protein
MTRTNSILSGFVIALIGSLTTVNASAHNFASHDAITRASVAAMHYWVEDNTEANFCPHPGDLPATPDFANYKSAVQNALAKLRTIKTGLKPVKYDIERCNGASNGKATGGYYHDDNLDKMGQIRISDFRYIVNRDYETGCALDALRGERLTKEHWRVLGSILGTLAGDVDRRDSDTRVWIKPTNAFVWGAIKDGLSEAAMVLGAIALAPFACFASLFSGGNCGDAKKWAIAYNPIDYAAGVIPGIPIDFSLGDIGLDVNGIWHFQQSEDEGSLLAFANNPSGMYYPFAGPSQIPGAIDTAVMGLTEATGVSLNARSATGVRDFGQFDEAGRAWPLWEAHALGMTEFTPLSKLAKYGVKEWDHSNHTTAEKLGYPLHAFADATFPQHIANTTGWGHRPMEDAMNNLRGDTLQFETYSDMFRDCHSPVDIILKGYEHWQYSNLGFGGHVNVEEEVESLALEARHWVDSHSGIWSDSASDDYLVNNVKWSIKSYTNERYDDHGMTLTQFSRPLELASSGAVIAFLVDAGLHATSTTVDTSTTCGTGSYFVHGEGCKAGSGSACYLPKVDEIAVTSSKETTSTCALANQPCITATDCCSNDCRPTGCYEDTPAME